jgi:hypothetical protein
MPSQPSCQDTNIYPWKLASKTSDEALQGSLLETQVEKTNQDANLAAGLAVLTTTLNKLNPINNQ